MSEIKQNITNELSEEELENVIIGIYDKKLSKKNNYNALLGLDILEGENEKSLAKI